MPSSGIKLIYMYFIYIELAVYLIFTFITNTVRVCHRCISICINHPNFPSTSPYSQGEIVPYPEFVRGNISRRGESWGSWGARVFISIPARYTWSLVKQGVGLDGPGRGVLVNTVVLTVSTVYVESF